MTDPLPSFLLDPFIFQTVSVELPFALSPFLSVKNQIIQIPARISRFIRITKRGILMPGFYGLSFPLFLHFSFPSFAIKNIPAKKNAILVYDSQIKKNSEFW